ncbi:MAG: hypothetical protein JNK58_13960 [Phycisphaerae bacterium]|nr:hypothetical protein [Phycisphaerae bacterium]
MPDPNATTLRGDCHVLFAFDLGFAIDLDRARARLSSPEPASPVRVLLEDRPTPKYVEFHPQPVRASEHADPHSEPIESIAGFPISPDSDATLFDFGAACLSYRIPFNAPLVSLLDLSVELYDHAALKADAHRRAQDLLRSLGDAITNPRIAPAVEDYVVVVIHPDSLSTSPDSFLQQHQSLIARLLRAEPKAISTQEESDALASRISYSPNDLTLIDWNGALVIQADPADLLAVLEFANVELLEMRHLDEQLDHALDEAYRLTQHPPGLARVLTRHAASDQQRIAKMQMDSALLFEGVNNALKLLGDQYLARVYRLAAQRLHLPAWDAAILRKLETLDSIYEKMSDRQATQRMEILEWIIILLIAFEVVKSLIDS